MTILDNIKAHKLNEIAQAKKLIPLTHIQDQAYSAQFSLPVRDFAKTLQNKKQQNQFGLIAEIKKASPSKGLIRENFDPTQLAKDYELGGATCLSVLTDEKFFQGHLSYLRQARQACQLPILRKDFIFDPYQIYEARAWGADCILLIMACLNDEEVLMLHEVALQFMLDVLIEVHNENELERALRLPSALIGINNRNLKDFSVCLETSERLALHIPKNRLPIAESGIFTHDDCTRLSISGISTFLVGESLMRQENVTLATQQLLQKTAIHNV